MRWLLFFPELADGAARVRVWRRLQRLGARSLKGAVWVLPDVPAAARALTWLRHELSDGGVEGVIARADWVEGLTDDQLAREFRQAAAARWQALAGELRAASPSQLPGLRRRVEDAVLGDFFGGPGRAEAERLLARLEAPGAPVRAPEERYLGRTWVTRKDIHVDRMASAWLIRRFIDPRARLRFVDLTRSPPRPGELGFDFHGAAFTHQGARCTFEVLQAKFRPKDRALRLLGELVHDLDLEDGRFGRPEAAGFGEQLRAIATAHRADGARLERASAVLDDLYAHRSSARGRRRRR